MFETMQALWQDGYIVSVGPPLNIAARFECKITRHYDNGSSVICGYGDTPEAAFYQAANALTRTEP